jgi:hypothetical protein
VTPSRQVDQRIRNVYAGQMVDDPRIVVPVRIRRSSRDRLDALARQRGWTRSDAFREALARGLAELERPAPRQARPSPKAGQR